MKCTFRKLCYDIDKTNKTELSREIDLSIPTINKLWNSSNLETIKLGSIIKVCKYFNCRIEDVISFKDSED